MSIKEQTHEYQRQLDTIKKLGGVVTIKHHPYNETKTRYWTECLISHGNVVAYGDAICCPRDTPNRKLGWAIAVGRALHTYNNKVNGVEEKVPF